MYLAPLNYDRFFKKVFSDTNIAKNFLEDFFDKTITDIKKLDEKHRITDDAAIVEFDYRCKINGKYIIIDMQQWHKSDVVKRFYLYHTLNTGLQLESLGTRSITDEADVKSNKIKQKNYNRIEPVYTIIWMVDDNFNFKQDYAEFSLQHQSAVEFIRDDGLWLDGDINNITSRRDEVVEVLNNKTKDIHFLSENKLVFMFQKNIVNNLKNNRSQVKYSKWFDFALKTKNKDNIVADFKEFAADSVFTEIIIRLRKDDLTKDDIEYLESEDENIDLLANFYIEQDYMMAKRTIEATEEGIEQGIEQEKIKQDKLKIENLTEMFNEGLTIEKASRFSGLSISEIQKLNIGYI